jgi:hypothetical protein
MAMHGKIVSLISALVYHSKVRQISLSLLLVLNLMLVMSMNLLAADTSIDDFYNCARFVDKMERYNCLDNALDDLLRAKAREGMTQAEPEEQTVTRSSSRNEARLEPIARVSTSQERIESFGLTEIQSDGDGEDMLVDTIVKLTERQNLLTITLASGQVWRQTYPRKLNLREGDIVEIRKAGFGKGFQLSTSRLSGFIRVERTN